MINIGKQSLEDQYKDVKDIKILNSDNQNRSNFDKSWNEIINKEEFDLRVMFSTCSFRLDKK